MASRWKVDRHVPIALIISLGLYCIAQTAGVSYWVASTNSRVELLEREVVPIPPMSERIIKLETNMDNLLASVKEIKDILRQQKQN